MNGVPVRTVAALALAAVSAACGSKSPTSPTVPPPPPTVAIMGASRLSAAQVAAWFNGRQPRPAGLYAATVPVETLAVYFVEEGAAE